MSLTSVAAFPLWGKQWYSLSVETRGTSERLEALTHTNLKGEVYRREAVVERQIGEALGLDPAELCQRAAISDPARAGYLQEEALAYLIRSAYRAGASDLTSRLSALLISRCTRLLRRRLASLGPDALEEGSAEIIARLFERLLDLDSDRGDYLQVRFWKDLDTMAIREFNRLLRQVQHTESSTNDDEQLGQPSYEAAVLDNDVIRDALGRIPEPHRSAFLLKHYYGWPVEDQDPNVRTISRHFGKDPRTIRNWLTRVDEILQPLRGEQHL